MVNTLEKHNEAFQLSKSLTPPDALLFSQACRNEPDAADNFVIRFLTDSMDNLEYFSHLARAYEWVEGNCQIGSVA